MVPFQPAEAVPQVERLTGCLAHGTDAADPRGFSRHKAEMAHDGDLLVGEHLHGFKSTAAEDRIRAFYEVRPGDLGMHIFIAPPERRIAGYSRSVFHALMRFMFEHASLRSNDRASPAAVGLAELIDERPRQAKVQ